MSDPTPNPNAPGQRPAQPPATEPGRKSALPLLWLVLLLALLAFGWFIYNQRAGQSSLPEAPPPAVDVGDAQDAAAERERAADDARRGARERAAAAAAPAPAPDSEPVPVNRVQPDYPASAYRDRVEGTVLVGIVVDPEGRAGTVDLVRRSGNRELDRAAVDAVKQWTFEPAVRNGRAVEGRVEVPVTFRIDDTQ